MISIRQVGKTYHAGETLVQALRGVSLEIGAGEFTALAGPSGSGKTTLLNILGCIDVPDQGTVTMEGVDLPGLDARSASRFRRENLGFIFQSFNLIPVLTARENVAMALQLLGLPAREAARKVQEILEEVGLEEMADRLPTRLSGGQQQRVAIARALVKKPRLVLADEPTANLDSATGESILVLMEELNRRHGVTFVFSTHDQMVMAHARRLVRLHDGAVQGDERRT